MTQGLPDNNGLLRLSGTELGGDLRLSRFRKDDHRCGEPTYQTVCSKIEMDMVTVDGDADLTGLHVIADNDETPVNASHMTIEGDLLFSPRCKQPGENQTAKIQLQAASENRGHIRHTLLDLSETSANEFYLSGYTFPSAEAPRYRSPCGVWTLVIPILRFSARILYLPFALLAWLSIRVMSVIDWLICGRLVLDMVLTWLLQYVAFLRSRFAIPKDEGGSSTGESQNVDAVRAAKLNKSQLEHFEKKFESWLRSKSIQNWLRYRKDDENGVLKLARTRFDSFCLQEPYPSDVDLSNIRVGKWEPGADDMLVILKKTTPFYRGTYLDVEKALKDKGHTSHAAKVFRAMRRRAEQDLSGIRWIFSRLAGVSTGYWTQSWRLLWVFAITFLLTYLVFYNPANVVATTGVLEVQNINNPSIKLAAKLKQTPADLGTDWGWRDALGMTVRYTVPIVSLFPAERWIPGRNDLVVKYPECFGHPLLWWEGFATCTNMKACESDFCISLCKSLTPEFFAMVVSILMWIVWPVFLIGISGVFRREQR